MTNAIYGNYQSPGDDREFEYDATWHQGPYCVTWNATVYGAAGETAMFPSGIVFGAGADESSVRARILSSVESCVRRMSTAQCVGNALSEAAAVRPADRRLVLQDARNEDRGANSGDTLSSLHDELLTLNEERARALRHGPLQRVNSLNHDILRVEDEMGTVLREMEKEPAVKD